MDQSAAGRASMLAQCRHWITQNQLLSSVTLLFLSPSFAERRNGRAEAFRERRRARLMFSVRAFWLTALLHCAGFYTRSVTFATMSLEICSLGICYFRTHRIATGDELRAARTLKAARAGRAEREQQSSAGH